MKNSTTSIGVIGLGIMGGIMAETLLHHKYKVCGFDVAASAMKRLKKAGGRALQSVQEVVEQSEVVIISLAKTEALHWVIGQINQAAPADKTKKQIIIETSTLPLADKQVAALALEKNRRIMLDCPISGTAARMRDRAWTIYLSGPRKACLQVEPILKAFTNHTPYIGKLGAGTKLKYAANHLVAIYNVAYAESVTLARKMGLDPRLLLEHFGNSAVLGTGVMRLRMPFMLDHEYSPPTMKIEVWQKDMQVIGDMAKSVDCPTPLFNASASIYTAAMAQGLSQQDTASTAEVLSKMAGLL